jgi:hypothetical protein
MTVGITTLTRIMIRKEMQYSGYSYAGCHSLLESKMCIKIGRYDIQHNDTQHNNIQNNDTQHKALICNTQHNKCHYAECRDFLIFMLNVILLSVALLSVVVLSVIVLSIIVLSVGVLSVIVLSVVVLSVVVLSVVVLSVVMLNVVAPQTRTCDLTLRAY